MRDGSCSEADCIATRVVARGLCVKHYKHWYRRREDGEPCGVASCEWPTYSSGYCAKHHHWWKRTGDPEDADKRRMRTRRHDNNGYMMVRSEQSQSGWEAEHRLVMEQILGRPLTSAESVHHKNGVRDDNRPSNLELWARYQPAGQRVEDLLTFADEIIERYRSR